MAFVKQDPVEAINWEEDDVTPWALRCADESAAEALEWMYGKDWRNQRLRLIDAAIIMVISPNAAGERLFRRKVKRREWTLTYGMVFDYQRRKNTRVTPLHYDTIQEWSREHKFSLARHRWLAIRFLRAAYAARTAGLPIEEAEFTMHQWDIWGIDRNQLWIWQGKPESPKWWMERVRYAPYTLVTGQTRRIRVYNVADALDWFLMSTITADDTTTDILRDRYRMVNEGCKRFGVSLQAKHSKSGKNQWWGAIGLQRAWNALHQIMQIETSSSSVPGCVSITTRRINHYLSGAIQRLAETDPDWTRQPLDVATIQPDARYAVVLPSFGAIETPMMIHTPAGAQLILIIKSAADDRTLRNFMDSRGFPFSRVAYTYGSHIIKHPYAYTR